MTVEGDRARIDAADPDAGLGLVTEVEAVPGGAVRARHTLTNLGAGPYVVDQLEVVFPLPSRVGEVLDFTGRQTAERIPQRHRLGDGLWLREGRRGHTGHDAATMVIAGVPGLGFGSGEAYGVHVAWSGNTVHRVERVPSGLGMAETDAGPRERMQPGITTIGGGELLLPGEIALAQGESYATPWVYLAASQGGLDDLAAQFHGYLRAQPAHPRAPRPVNLNVWEAVYFRHDLDKLTALADAAADLGAERFVLDDGWFQGRRDDRAGLGDWWVDEDVWPGGLHRLIDHVRGRGLQFGLWIEPEMVNPDSELFRAHPDWILSAGHRRPPLQRHQLVLDLTRPPVREVSAGPDLSPAERVARSPTSSGTATGTSSTPAAEPGWERLPRTSRPKPVYSAAGRVAGPGTGKWSGSRARPAAAGSTWPMLEHVQRVWTSDMTDALARQSNPALDRPSGPRRSTSARTWRRRSPIRPAGTCRCRSGARPPSSGTSASKADITRDLARGPGRTGRLDRVVQAAPRAHPLRPHGPGWTLPTTPRGCTAWSRRTPRPRLMSYVQLDEPRNDQPTALRVPGLDPAGRYRITDVTPGPRLPRRPRARPAAVRGP